MRRVQTERRSGALDNAQGSAACWHHLCSAFQVSIDYIRLSLYVLHTINPIRTLATMSLSLSGAAKACSRSGRAREGFEAAATLTAVTCNQPSVKALLQADCDESQGLPGR